MTSRLTWAGSSLCGTYKTSSPADAMVSDAPDNPELLPLPRTTSSGGSNLTRVRRASQHRAFRTTVGSSSAA